MLPPLPRGDTLVEGADQQAATWHAAPKAGEAVLTLPVIPGYQVLSLLGRGAMGRVYQALHLGLKRHDAIKMVSVGADAQMLQRFAVEAQALAKVRHPNVAQIYGAGEAEGQPFLAMELVEGGTLADHLAGRPQDPLFAAQLIETVARAVQHCHQEGVLHRDLKPGNILLEKDLTPKITDFGLAKLVQSESQKYTATGDVLGTPGYMAPEQAGGVTKDLGPGVDVYALGSILYECLTGRPPFQTPEVFQTLLLVMTQEPVPPSVLLPKLPRDLNTIVMKCLEKAPKRRYATAAELADDLRRFREGQPIAARPIARVEKAWRWLRRHPAAAAMLVLGLALLVTMTVAYIQVSLAKAESDLRLQVGREAVTELVKRVLFETPTTPETEKLKQTVLDDYKRVIAAFANTRPGDVDSQEKLILDHLQLAKAAHDLGQFELVEEMLARADQLASAVVKMTGQERYEVYQFAVLNHRVRLAIDQGKRELALGHQRAAQNLDQALAKLPLDPVVLEERARFSHESGRLARPNWPEVERHHRAALQLLEQLAARLQYQQGDKVRDLAVAHSNVATALLMQKKHQEAAQALQKARDLIPSDRAPRNRELLGQIQSNQGVVAEELKQTEEAVKAYTVAAYLFEQLAREYPSNPQYRFNFAKVKLNLVIIAAMQGQSASAKPTLEAVRPILEQLVKEHPTNAAFQAELKRYRMIAENVEADLRPPGAKP